MSTNLVIVESPAKAKTIKKYLGKSFEVLASYGHVRDLVAKGKVKVVPAVYDLASGKVAWLDPVRTAPVETAHH